MDDEVSHQSDEGDFGGLAPGDEMLITVFQGGVVTAGDECGHVKRFARQRSAATDKTFALPAAAFSCMRSHACQGGGLGAIEFAQFRHFGQQTDQRFRADADDLLETVGFGLEGAILLEQGLDLLLEFLQVGAELAEERGVLFAQSRQCQVAALLGHVLGHRLELQAMAGQLAQGGGGGVERGLRARGGLPAKLGQQRGIDPIGFGAQGAGFGEVPHPRGFDNRHGDAGLVAGGHDGLLITARGFTDDQHRFDTGL